MIKTVLIIVGLSMVVIAIVIALVFLNTYEDTHEVSPTPTQTIEHTFNVTVTTKLLTHPFHGKGSDNTFTINGNSNYDLKLEPNKTYRFILDDTTVDHGFILSQNIVGSTNIGKVSWWPRALTDETLIIKIPNSCPVLPVYFVCNIHENMGVGKPVVFKNCIGPINKL